MLDSDTNIDTSSVLQINKILELYIFKILVLNKWDINAVC